MPTGYKLNIDSGVGLQITLEGVFNVVGVLDADAIPGAYVPFPAGHELHQRAGLHVPGRLRQRRQQRHGARVASDGKLPKIASSAAKPVADS